MDNEPDLSLPQYSMSEYPKQRKLRFCEASSCFGPHNYLYIFGGEQTVTHCPGPPERANREGDQPLPVSNDSPYVQDAVISDIEKRIELGIKRYGTALQINNGRDMLKDAYDEAMDLCIYLKGCLMERDAKS
jgi:hypothetical protein